MIDLTFISLNTLCMFNLLFIELQNTCTMYLKNIQYISKSNIRTGVGAIRLRTKVYLTNSRVKQTPTRHLTVVMTSF